MLLRLINRKINSVFDLLLAALFWCVLEGASFLYLYCFDFYYLLPFPAAEPNASLVYQRKMKPLLKRHDIHATSWVLSDEDLLWRLKPHLNFRAENINLREVDGSQYKYFVIKTNSQGFRSPEFTQEKNPSVSFRVVGIGDSHMFGWAVDDACSFMGILRAQLGQQGGEVINLGQPGYSSTQGVGLFKKYVPGLKPDMLLVWYGGNDQYEKKGLTDSKIIAFNHTFLGSMHGFLFRHSYVFRVLTRIFWPLTESRGGSQRWTRRVPPLEFERNISAIASSCKEQNIKVVLLTRFKPDDPYAATLKQVARNYDCQVFCVRDLFRKKTVAGRILIWKRAPSWDAFESRFLDEWIIPVDGHQTLKGNRVIAESLYRLIQDTICRN